MTKEEDKKYYFRQILNSTRHANDLILKINNFYDKNDYKHFGDLNQIKIKIIDNRTCKKHLILNNTNKYYTNHFMICAQL